MAQDITVSCIKCDLTNILLLCWSQNRGCRASDASHSLVQGIWAFGCNLKPHLWLRVHLFSKQKWNHLQRIWSVVHCIQFVFHACVFLLSPLKLTSILIPLCCRNFIVDPLPSFPSLVYLSHTWSSHKAKNTCQSSWQAVSHGMSVLSNSHPQSWKAGGKSSIRKGKRAQSIQSFPLVFPYYLISVIAQTKACWICDW